MSETTASSTTRTAVVTGASSGIGRETARQLRAEGWTVYAAARRAERLEELMYEVNVLGTLNTVRAFLPDLRANGRGTVLNLTSTAAEAGYEGGGGYNAAKFAERGLTEALRLEEAEHNVRVIEIRPGMVRTEEFSLNRLGSREAADAVYRGVEQPLTAEDVARVNVLAVTLPHHIALDTVTLRPVAQAAQHKVIRRDPS
ncbi:short-chain type oxidoreductase [Mycobacteroides abscessus subsp. abscessus]|nr:short-chain type oxidoreductase [Mycobacteroides abscessus subsp. abscessus]